MTIEAIDARGYSLRHVHPTATFESEGGTATVLGKTYGFTWLPTSHTPTDPGFVEGSYTSRLGDAGEFSITFPNAATSLGFWRDRFSTDRALEFIEIYRDDVLEFVGSIQRVEIDRGVVTVSGADAWSLLRRAYEGDRTWTAAPQEVGTAYTRVPVALLADDFDGTSLDAAWSTSGSSGGDGRTVANGRVKLTITGTNPYSNISQVVVPTSDCWTLTAVLRELTPNSLVGPYHTHLIVGLIDAGAPNNINTVGSIWCDINGGGDIYFSVADGSFTDIFSRRSPNQSDHANMRKLLPATVQIVRRARWVSCYVNGLLIGTTAYRARAGTDRVVLQLWSDDSGASCSLEVDSIVLTEHQDFLARGSDQGDYVLPGDQPIGGLRGRYWNHTDMQGLTLNGRLVRMMAPEIEPYGERLDAVIDTAGGLSLPMQPGNAGDYFAVRWFGSVYLRGDLGNYTFEVTSVLDGVRLWVGKTSWDDRGNMIDDWTTGAGTDTATWTASDYGSEAGWYPIVLDYFCDTGTPAITLKFTPPASTYTDPGGTSITASTKIVIPSTSLSPLGCYDNRVQGSSHFELVQGAASQFGYQLWCEPMQLESGEFPGRLVPRLRVGRDTDVVLEVEDQEGVEPALSPGVTIDATDQAVSLSGSGAGLADGQGSQVTAQISDLSLIDTALFVLQANVDAADIAFPDLLEARLNAELSLRTTPWEEVRATPRAQERLADTWPLSQTLSAMRWRPGDGLRLRVPDIGVEDAEPRQMLQVTRAFAGEGRTGTQVGFRQRPRSVIRSLLRGLRAAIAPQRSYQGRVIPLTGQYVNPSGASTAAAGFTEYSMVPLQAGDRVVKAIVRITANSAAQALDLEINGALRASDLGGTWSNAPTEVNVTTFATQASSTDNRLFVRAKNTGGVSTIINLQLIVEVQR